VLNTSSDIIQIYLDKKSHPNMGGGVLDRNAA
jgi:hypothetical protein